MQFLKEIMENVKNRRDINLVVTEGRRNYLVSKLNYHTIQFFFKKFMSNRNEKNKPVYLALSILEMSKTVMYGFWCDYVKPKYKEQAKLCYMGTDRFIVYIKTRNDIDIVKDVETRFDTLRYELMKIKKQKAQEVCHKMKT